MAILQGGSYLGTVTAETDLTGATVGLTVTAPDQSITVVDPSSIDVEGKAASATVLGAQLGTYLLVWTILGATADIVQDQFTVERPGLDLLSISELRDELNLDPSYSAEDSELRRMLRAARGVIEHITGCIVPTAKTVVVNGGNSIIVLPFDWVVSITSVTEWTGSTAYPLTEQAYGAATDGYGYTWDRDTNILTRRGYYTGVSRFAAGVGNVSIALIAGMTTIPTDIQQATARLIEHWWRKQHNSWRAGGMFTSTPSDEAGISMVGNYEIPNAVMELLEPWRKTPRIA